MMREDTRETISTSVLLYARATLASCLLKKLSGKSKVLKSRSLDVCPGNPVRRTVKHKWVLEDC